MAAHRMGKQLSFSGFKVGSPQTDRLIFLAQPDEFTARRVSHVAHALKCKHQLRGEPFSPSRLHISLLHIGDFYKFPADIVVRTKEAASGLVFPSFDVVFDRVMSFSGVEAEPPREDSYALVLLASKGATELTALRKALALSTARAGIKSRYRLHRKPHMTLLYDKWHRIVEDIEPIHWTVNGFAFIDSLLGRSRYKQLGRWSLTGRRPVQSASPLLEKSAIAPANRG
jgi:RNA 2',3'-cyclic 3'-phosphodiesterase